MKPAPFRYLRAASLDDALQALADNPDARILAGGQSLIAMMNLRLIKPACLIDINRIAHLGYIREEGDGVAIGALARHNDVKHSPLVGARCPLLTEAYESIAHHTVRNRGTLGGNLCHADPSSETPAVMIASGATLVLRSLRAAARLRRRTSSSAPTRPQRSRTRCWSRFAYSRSRCPRLGLRRDQQPARRLRHSRDRDDAAARQRALRGGARGGERGRRARGAACAGGGGAHRQAHRRCEPRSRGSRGRRRCRSPQRQPRRCRLPARCHRRAHPADAAPGRRALFLRG